MKPTRDQKHTLVDLLDRVLDRGVILHADLIISVSGIPLVGVSLKAAVAGIETMLEYGYFKEWDQEIRELESRAEHEEIVISMSGSFDEGVSLHSHWKFCNVVLTPQRLVCYQVHRILASIPIKNILSLEIEKREWILGKKVKQLCIRSLGNKLIYLGVCDPEKWILRISSGTSTFSYSKEAFDFSLLTKSPK